MFSLFSCLLACFIVFLREHQTLSRFDSIMFRVFNCTKIWCGVAAELVMKTLSMCASFVCACIFSHVCSRMYIRALSTMSEHFGAETKRDQQPCPSIF